jgi:hypothetical protein
MVGAQVQLISSELDRKQTRSMCTSEHSGMSRDMVNAEKTVGWWRKSYQETERDYVPAGLLL